MTAEILTIGDELLIGQVINTNQAHIARELNGIGIPVARMSTVGDDMAVLLEALPTPGGGTRSSSSPAGWTDA